MLLMDNGLSENIVFIITQKTCSNKQVVNRAYILWVLLIIATYYRIEASVKKTIAIKA